MGRNASVTGAATLLTDMEDEFQAVRQSLQAMLENQ